MKVPAPVWLCDGLPWGRQTPSSTTQVTIGIIAPTSHMHSSSTAIVSDLQKEYDLIALFVAELPIRRNAQLMCGNHRAKLAALWEGTFEFYVWRDSDAIVWSDFTSQVRTDLDFQIFGVRFQFHPRP
jgi:hypothetical protein